MTMSQFDEMASKEMASGQSVKLMKRQADEMF
jgi:hypothetical protein